MSVLFHLPLDCLPSYGFLINTLTSIRKYTIIKDTVSILGGFYAAQNPHLLTMTKAKKGQRYEGLSVSRTLWEALCLERNLAIELSPKHYGLGSRECHLLIHAQASCARVEG